MKDSKGAPGDTFIFLMCCVPLPLYVAYMVGSAIWGAIR